MNTGISLSLKRNVFPTDGIFAISRGPRISACVLTLSLTSNGKTGWSECCPYVRYGESLDSVSAQIMAMQPALQQGLDRKSLQEVMPAGAARNALDCALWDLQSKQSGTPVWQLAGLSLPVPVITSYTLSLDTPDNMRRAAENNAARPILKIKLGGRGDLDRLRAVRAGAPNARLIVDANEGWSAETYDALVSTMMSLGVVLVEQPLHVDEDRLLSSRSRPLPMCADEACHDRYTLGALVGKYDVVNIKLDKTGGLTEALALRAAALDAGFKVMVGCMVGSSLAMAPALLLAQGAHFVDLDGPLLLAEDREIPMRFEGSLIYPACRKLWG